MSDHIRSDQVRSGQVRSHHLLAILSAVVVVPDKPGLKVNFNALSLGLESGQLWPVYVVDAVDGAREDGVAHLFGRRRGNSDTVHSGTRERRCARNMTHLNICPDRRAHMGRHMVDRQPDT